jgi:hypothetical protein
MEAAMLNLLARELNKERAAALRRAKAPDASQDTSRVGQVDPMAQRFDVAIQLLEVGCWSQAFAELSELANHGHPPASRIALMLMRRGPSLFGGAFPATPQEQARWQGNGERSTQCAGY